MNELATPASVAPAIDSAFDRLDDFLAVQRPLGIKTEQGSPINLLQESVGIDADARSVIADRASKLADPQLAPAILLGVIIGLSVAEAARCR